MSLASSGITIGKFFAPDTLDSFQNLIRSIGTSATNIAPIVTQAFTSIGTAITSTASTIAQTATSLGKSFALKTKASALWIKTNTLKAASFVKLKAAMMATAIKTKALALATKFATAAQKIFNLVMKANPVGLVIAAVAALAAGLALFFTQTETGRGVWQQLTAVFSLAGDAISGLIAWLRDAISSIRENEQVMNIC